MPEFGYSSFSPAAGAKQARAMGVDVEASFKDLSQVCASIKGKSVGDAKALLEKACEGEAAIPYRKFSRKLGHRRELGGKKGRYPKKASRAVLKVLENAKANASFKGLGEPLFVAHACANKMRVFPRLQSKGRRVRHDYETSKVEIILLEAPGAKPAEKKEAEKQEKKHEKKEEKKAKALA